jgi:TetR/AcrR family transcriptional regulator, cholesterol catabolism regulator
VVATTPDVAARADGRAPDPESLPAHLRQRRDRIVQAAVELLEHDEYDAIQMRDVAKAADVALGTIYRYFTSKEHLYAEALLAWSRGFELRPRRGSGPDDDANRLRSLLRAAARAFDRQPQMLRARIAIETSADPNARACWDEFSTSLVATFRGVLRDTPPRRADAVVQVTTIVMDTSLRSWALGRQSMAGVLQAIDDAVDLIYSPPPGS